MSVVPEFTYKKLKYSTICHLRDLKNTVSPTCKIFVNHNFRCHDESWKCEFYNHCCCGLRSSIDAIAEHFAYECGYDDVEDFYNLIGVEKYGGVGESPCVSCKIVQYIGNPECTSCMRVREWIDLRDRSDKLIKAHLQSIGIVGD